MTTDRVFVLLMMVLLMMAGCFEATSTTEAQEEQDSTSGDDSTDSSTPNGGNTATNSQERVWYSSGGVINSHWSDGVEYNGYEKCFEYGPLYDSETGEYVGEECKRYGIPSFESDWNVSNCTDIGGTPYWNSLDGYETQEDGSNYAYRWSPACTDIPLVTISTNPGEVLMIYQQEGVNWDTTCGGVTFDVYKSSSLEYEIVEGSSMSCIHELTHSMSYETDFSFNNPYIWSIVYEIQDTVVV